MLTGASLLLSMSPVLADAMCGPNGEFNPMDNRCWPIQNPQGNGGGGEPRYLPPEPTWGAIAVDVSPTGKTTGSFSSSKKNQSEANKGALNYCGRSSCKVVVSFKNSCGAVASGDNGRWGVGVDVNKSRALQKAADECYAKGAKVCREWVAPTCANAPRI